MTDITATTSRFWKKPQVSLAQALRYIAQLKADLAVWNVRRSLSSVTRVETEGKITSSAVYTFEECSAHVGALRKELTVWKTFLAQTNALTTVTVDEDSLSLTFLILMLDELKGEIAFYSSFKVGNASTVEQVDTQVYRRDSTGTSAYVTVPVVTTYALDTRGKDETLQELKDRFAQLNGLLEATNHMTIVKAPI
jgi:hypothetical protein